jgi:hypothetical protein
MFNHWLHIINRRKIQRFLENSFMGERYAEVVYDLSHEMTNHALFHEDFTVNLIVDDHDKILEIQVI